MPEVTRRHDVVYIGIDPGASGGIAAIDHSQVLAAGTPDTDRFAWDFLLGRMGSGLKYAVIERNTGYVGDGGNPGSAMFKFGRSAGLLTGFLIAAGIPYEEVTPALWQKALGIAPRKKGKGAESKAQFKRRLKGHAERLFPEVKVTLATCDALLIAEYCRRKREGRL